MCNAEWLGSLWNVLVVFAVLESEASLRNSWKYKKSLSSLYGLQLFEQRCCLERSAWIDTQWRSNWVMVPMDQFSKPLTVRLVKWWVAEWALGKQYMKPPHYHNFFLVLSGHVRSIFPYAFWRFSLAIEVITSLMNLICGCLWIVPQSLRGQSWY